MYFTDLTATLANPMVSVVENEVSVEVCISLSETALERDITISVQSQPDTATGIMEYMLVWGC